MHIVLRFSFQLNLNLLISLVTDPEQVCLVSVSEAHPKQALHSVIHALYGHRSHKCVVYVHKYLNKTQGVIYLFYFIFEVHMRETNSKV